MSDDLNLAIKVALTLLVIALSPIDVLGDPTVPIAPDKSAIALLAIWGVDSLGGGD